MGRCYELNDLRGASGMTNLMNGREYVIFYRPIGMWYAARGDGFVDTFEEAHRYSFADADRIIEEDSEHELDDSFEMQLADDGSIPV